MEWVISVLDSMQDTSKVLLGFFFAWLIFYIQQAHSEKKEKEAIIKAFYMEIRRNLLTCGLAMRDETRIACFELESWAKIKTGNYISLHQDMILYIYEIENVNRLINDFRSYEKEYTSGFIPTLVVTEADMRLEAKRERVKSALKTLYETIKTAKETFKKQI